MRMTWKTLTDLLAREFRNLRRMHVITFGFASAPVTDSEDLRNEELKLAERVDSIVRDYARTRRWPALDEKERFFLRERIRFAYEYASLGEFSVKRPVSLATRAHVSNEQRRLLEWLLIDAWRSSGVKNWIQPLQLLTQATRCSSPAWHLHISE